MADCHQRLRLHISEGAYTLVPEKGGDSALVLDRTNNELRLSPAASAPGVDGASSLVAGVFGTIALLQSDYLVLIKSVRKISVILGADVYTPTAFSIYPVSRASNTELLSQPNEGYLLSLLKAHLRDAEGKMFFTYSAAWDATSPLQRQGTEGPLWKRADDRFFWNRYLQNRLIDLCSKGQAEACSPFIIPVAYGFFEVKTAKINSHVISFGLVSRRSRHRAGTRYFSRGIDSQGNVSNFNETEMLLFAQNGQVRASFVQTRGSVPVYWTEINNLRYKPDLQIMELEGTTKSLKTHFDEQIATYGDQYLVNLVNTSGYEKPVKEAYERGVADLNNPSIHYVYFDFHHECKGLRFDRVQGLIDRLEPDLIQQGYFFQSGTRPARRQTSVVRTNCMDCLDRTNVVQSALAKWMLTDQLRQAGILGNQEVIDSHKDFMFLFRNVWADNADAVSKAYSGTGALKTDFTRFGIRSNRGALQDGVNSAVRYLKNNFFDGPRQDAYDLVTGSWRPAQGGGTDQLPSASLPPFLLAMPYVALFAMLLIVLVVTAPHRVSAYIATPAQVLLVSMTAFTFALVVMMTNGVDYVNGPRLKPLDERLSYSGPGHSSGKHGRGFGKRQAKGGRKRLD